MKKFFKFLFFSCNLYSCRVNFASVKKTRRLFMAKKKQELTEAEWDIVRAVWENQPCAAPTVQEALEKKKGWSYSTVKTLMDRMVKKGLLKTEKIRNLTLYRSAISEKQAKKGEIMKTV